MLYVLRSQGKVTMQLSALFKETNRDEDQFKTSEKAVDRL